MTGIYKFLKKSIIPLCLFALLSFPILCHQPSQQEKRVDFKIVRIYPHARDAFTQGLIYEDGFLFESTGQFGSSTLRKVRLETGEVLKLVRLPQNIFGEGIASFGDKIIQLTWFSGKAFVYNKNGLKLVKTLSFPITAEGWGLTSDGTHLIMSTGTQRLYFLDPVTFELMDRIDVHDHEGPVFKINELEYVKGTLFANVWQSNKILMIDPKTGRVLGYLDLSGLEPKEYRGHADNVLNGIAYNREINHLYVTGKFWPNLYELEVEFLLDQE